MRFVVSLWFVFLCMLIACGSADAKSSRFTHPAYAYSLVPPQDYAVRPFVDALGIPYYVLTDERSAGAAAITRGVWITAYPIPTDDELDAKTVAPLLTALMAVGAPGLKIDAARTPTKLGAMDAVSMDVGGTHGKGAWRGRIVLAVQADNVLVVRYGAPAAQFDGLRPRFEAVLASIEAPLPFRPIRFGETGPLPEEKARALLRQCTPRVRVFARRDVKDPATATIDFASGTGFLFHPAGYVMTNRHVVETNTVGNLTRLCYDPVELVFDASLKIPPQRARVVAVSQQWDLALLRIEGDRTWPVVPLADPARVRPDHELLVAGWPEPQKYGTKGVNIAKGKVIGLEPDRQGRPYRLRHDAFTRPGSSGGPIFDRTLGAVVATHYMAYTVRGLVNGVWIPMPGSYKGGVPIARLLWEFPQVAAHGKNPARSVDERRALIAYFLLQERFGAAFIEVAGALGQSPEDGMTNAYAYRMYALQRDTERAQRSLLIARRKPESSYPVVLFASQSALEIEAPVESARWNVKAFELAPQHPATHLAMARTQVASGGSSAHAIHGAQQALGGVPNPELERMKGLFAVTRYLKSNAVISLPPRRPPSQQVLVDAIVALERSIELWPARQGVAWANLGILHAVDGRTKKAAECRARALRAAPGDVYTQLAVAHFDLLHGEFGNARTRINEANRIRATNFALFLTGWANLLEAKRTASADMKKARQLATVGKRQVGISMDGPQRQMWWRSYAASVSSGVLR